MTSLQIPSSIAELIDWFNVLDIELKVLIGFVILVLGMVVIFITFKFLEVIFLILQGILNIFVKIFRRKPKQKEYLIEQSGKSPFVEESSTTNQTPAEKEKSEPDSESEQSETLEKLEMEVESELITNSEKVESSTQVEIESKVDAVKMDKTLSRCPNCGNGFSEEMYSIIGQTNFVTCKNCEKRFIVEENNISPISNDK